jgi:peptidoglycan/xylan/chitin deacetylase (PgdA/CDA1 family)
MIAGADVTSVNLTTTVWRYLQDNGFQPASVFVITNRPVGLQGLTKAEAEETIGLPIKAGMPYLAENMSLANNQHHPYAINFPGDTASIVMQDAAQQMIGLAEKLRAAST